MNTENTIKMWPVRGISLLLVVILYLRIGFIADTFNIFEWRKFVLYDFIFLSLICTFALTYVARIFKGCEFK